MGLIQRECSGPLLKFVKAHKIFDLMRTGIAAGDILPCLRKNEIHFYEGGACLFRFRPRSVSTHRQYIDCEGKGYRALSGHEHDLTTFDRVRAKARKHRIEDKSNELAAVHGLFSAFSITRSDHKHGELALIDIEARFGKDDVNGLPIKMIDLVFLMPDQHVLFVEAKCMGNSDVGSSGMAKVEAQVEYYQRHIRHTSVLDAINYSIKIQLQLINRKTAEISLNIFRRVPILLLDPSDPKRQIGPRNTWLRERLCKAYDWTIDSERPLVIDGTSDAFGAIGAFVEKFSGSRVH